MKTNENQPIPAEKIPEVVKAAQFAHAGDDASQWINAVFGQPADEKAVEAVDEIVFRGDKK